MREVLRKLKYVHVRSPLLMQPRIALIIDAISLSPHEGIKAPVLNNIEVKDTTLSLLQDNADSFLALMRTLPKKHKFKEAVGEVQALSDKLATKLEEAGQELSEILQTDESDLPGIKASALGTLADLLQGEKAKLADLQELTKTLGTLAGRAHKEEVVTPVEHKLPSKNLESDSKKKSKDTNKLPEKPEAGAKATKPTGDTEGDSIPALSLM